MIKPRKPKLRPAVGWREWVGLPELGIAWIKAKVDSGARSSCLHAFDVEVFKQGSQRYVRFKVHPIQRDRKNTVESVAPLLEFRNVKSSSGHLTRRPVILTPVQLLGECFEVEVTLAARDAMGFRMLLGRQAVRGKFVIDTGHSYLAGLPPLSQAGTKKHRGNA